jgi:archaeal type IV pilus assembly protein PilA
MNIWGKNERSWRRKNKRAVSPIIATILLVAITVVLAAVLYILIQQYTKNGSNGSPLGTAFAFSGSTDASSTGNNYYNMTIEQAGSTLSFGNLLFQLKTAGGSVFVTGVALLVVNPSGVTEAAFCMGSITTGGVTCAGSGGWVYNGNHCSAPAFTTACTSTSVLSTSSFLSLAVTPNTVSLAGYTLYALGQGAYSGSVSGPIT